MADFLQRFNEVSNFIVHISDLVVNKKYPIARVDSGNEIRRNDPRQYPGPTHG